MTRGKIIKYWKNEYSSQNYQVYQLTSFSGVINFVLYVRLESFHSKLFHVYHIFFELCHLNCTIPCFLTCFYIALPYQYSYWKRITAFFFIYSEIRENFHSLIFTIHGKFALVLKHMVRQHLFLLLCNIESRDGTV